MKADKNFNMAKPTKKLLATFTDKVARGLFKKAMIDAQVSYEAAKKKALSSKKESEQSS
jgi:hypothetical protein